MLLPYRWRRYEAYVIKYMSYFCDFNEDNSYFFYLCILFSCETTHVGCKTKLKSSMNAK